MSNNALFLIAAARAFIVYEQAQYSLFENAPDEIEAHRIAIRNANMAREQWRLENARPLVMSWNEGQCLRPGCHRRAIDPHHINPRGSGDLGVYEDHPANLAPLCRVCHDDLHGGRLPGFDRDLRDRAAEMLPPWVDLVSVAQPGLMVKQDKPEKPKCLGCDKVPSNKAAMIDGYCGICRKDGKHLHLEMEVNP